jgi:hypothetical protein
MYLQNKYTRIYNNIIERAKSRIISGYAETHHIIPKSIGGTNDTSNLVRLTAREHYICHRLLPKMLTGNDQYKMLTAVWFMSKDNTQTKYRPNSRTYAYLKETYSKKQSEWMKGRYVGDKNPFKGRKHSEETLAIIRAKTKGNKNHSVPHNDETKAKISASLHKHKCPHCGKEGRGGLMKHWHFDNCKNKKL